MTLIETVLNSDMVSRIAIIDYLKQKTANLKTYPWGNDKKEAVLFYINNMEQVIAIAEKLSQFQTEEGRDFAEKLSSQINTLTSIEFLLEDEKIPYYKGTHLQELKDKAIVNSEKNNLIFKIINESTFYIWAGTIAGCGTVEMNIHDIALVLEIIEMLDTTDLLNKE